MEVKKIEAPTMKAALEKAKILLGEDAVILSQKEKQKGGIFGLFSKKVVEVIAAIDTNESPKPKAKSTTIPSTKPKTPVAPTVTKNESTVLISEPALPSFDMEINRKPVINKEIQKIFQAINNEPAPTPKREPLTASINEESERLAKEIAKNKKLQEELKSLKSQNTQAPSTQTSSDYVQFFPEPLRKLHSYLKEQEINEIYSDSLISRLVEKCYLQPNKADFETVKKWAHDQLAQDLSLFKFGGVSFKKKYINIVGPTGVGKTTTIAKIAAVSKLEHKKKVALITADTYRISAIDQLKTYARLLELPMEIVYSVDDFKKAKEAFADYDLVLIDTAGRNYRDSKYVEELKMVIDFNEEVESYLVLSLTSKFKDMRDIYKKFSTVPINQLIFTKMDETGNYGAMLNLLMETKTGVAYLTNGQEVPDDIVEATPRTIADTLLKDGR